MFENECRSTCWKCIRPVSHCHCDLMKPFLAESNLLILQHPAEKKRFYSTTKLLTQWVTNCKLVCGIEFNRESILGFFPDTDLLLLYPAEEGIPAKSLQLSKKQTIVVLDGTWTQAKRIYRENEWLKFLPHISLQSSLLSNYRIRKQPRAECLSTIEALAFLFIENSTFTNEEKIPYRQLLKGFSQMIDTHLKSVPEEKVAYYDPV